MKTTMCKMKNKLHGIYNKLDSARGKISKLEAIAIQTIQNKTQKGNKDQEKMNRASVSCETTLGGLMHM